MTLTTGSVTTQTVVPHTLGHAALGTTTTATLPDTIHASAAVDAVHPDADQAHIAVSDTEPGATESPRTNGAGRARVSFVGAGPGDPDLLTVRAAALLADADVLVIDPGLRSRFVPRCHPAVEVIELEHDAAAGDLPGGDAPSGDALSDGAGRFAHAALPLVCIDQISDAVRDGKSVVRLLDGDPGLFGTFAAEAAACAQAGLPFEVVPGLARATAVPVFAGIPLTKGSIGDVRLLSAPRLDDHADFTAWSDWHRQLGEAGAATSTLVLMGIGERIDEVAAELLAAGRPGDTPVAVTVDGSLTSQRTITGTLDRIAAGLKAEHVMKPAADTVVVVGSVVERRAELSWYETKPLFGWRVLVPRTKEQAGALSEQLRSYGAVPHEVPTIAVEPPRTPQQMERAVKGLVTGRYEWVAFTSANAVKAVAEKFEEYGLDARAFAGIKVASVGEQTAEGAARVRRRAGPGALGRAVRRRACWRTSPPTTRCSTRSSGCFLPRADIATETLVAGLVELGWEVDDVTAYRTVRAAPPPAEIREAIKGGGFDAVLFTSSSTVKNLVGIAGKPHASTVIACIGPQTAKTAEEHGLRVDVLAPRPERRDAGRSAGRVRHGTS